MQSPEALTKSMLFRMVRDKKHAQASRLATLTAALKFEPALNPDTIWPMLYILNDLRGTANHSPSSPQNLNISPTFASIPTQLQSLSINSSSQIPSQLPDPSDPSDPSVNLPASQSPFLSSYNSRTANGTRVENGANGIQKPTSPRHVAPLPLLQNKPLEKCLVEDLILLVQGENGRLLTFEQDEDNQGIQFHLPPSSTLSLPTRDMVLYIAELGFLFRIICHRVDPPVGTNGGQVAENMSRAIVCEMDNYYRSLVTLRGGLSRTDIEGHGADGLTLRKVFVWSETERPRLRWLARLCEETSNLHGGQILAHLRNRRGSYVPTDIRDMMSRILASTAAPINRMLIRWLSEGLLDDPHSEFFIMEDPKVAAASIDTPYSTGAMMEYGGVLSGLAGGPNMASSASNRIWWGLFKLRKDRLPGSVSSNLAQKALIAGKSIAFLRRCCLDSEWVDQFHGPMVSSMIAGGKKLFEADHKFDVDEVAALIEATKNSVSLRLKELFFDKFDLSHHFGAIKRYLLLSQGDFAQGLMDGLSPILGGDANILRNNLTGFVDTALQGSSSFNPATDQDILERLDVKIMAHSGTPLVGWDVFSLTYRVEDAPLNTVFSPKVMDAYLLIFRFLWRLKRMDHLMGTAYMDLRDVDSLKTQDGLTEENNLSQKYNSLIKQVHFLRMKMTHLVHNLQHYCSVEVLEASWAVLERDLGAAEDLDGMIQAHSKYLTSIKDRTLLSDRSKYVASALGQVLDTIPLFDYVRKEICAWKGEPKKMHREINEQNEAVEEMHSKLSNIEEAFDMTFKNFLVVLKKHCKMVDTCVFLLFRLDFNEHYSQLSAKEKFVIEEVRV